MEIERKFLIKKEQLPKDLANCSFHKIEQGYLCTDPVVRIRRQDEEYYLTYKGTGLLAREEYNLPLSREGYEHLRPKADGNIISKKRYLIPITDTALKVELDIFDAPFAPLMIAEVEFPDVETANAFTPLDWFQEDVTNNPEYHNSNLSKRIFQP